LTSFFEESNLRDANVTLVADISSIAATNEIRYDDTFLNQIVKEKRLATAAIPSDNKLFYTFEWSCHQVPHAVSKISPPAGLIDLRAAFGSFNERVLVLRGPSIPPLSYPFIFGTHEQLNNALDWWTHIGIPAKTLGAYITAFVAYMKSAPRFSPSFTCVELDANALKAGSAPDAFYEAAERIYQTSQLLKQRFDNIYMITKPSFSSAAVTYLSKKGFQSWPPLWQSIRPKLNTTLPAENVDFHQYAACSMAGSIIGAPCSVASGYLSALRRFRIGDSLIEYL
jgi:hypothetical protein